MFYEFLKFHLTMTILLIIILSYYQQHQHIEKRKADKSQNLTELENFIFNLNLLEAGIDYLRFNIMH